MKATIDIPDDIYRRVKAKSAMEGRPVREVAIELFCDWLSEGERESGRRQGDTGGFEKPGWFGALRHFADNAEGRHDMDSVRNSIALGRARGQKIRR